MFIDKVIGKRWSTLIKQGFVKKELCGTHGVVHNSLGS